MSRCHEAVEAAAGKGVFSEPEIDDLLDRLAAKAKRAKAEAPTASDAAAIRTAAAELTRDEVFAALQARRVEVANRIAKAARETAIDAMPAKMAADKRLSAYLVGAEDQGFGTSASVDAEGRARSVRLLGQLDQALEAMAGLKGRMSNFFLGQESGFDIKIMKEVARINGDGSVEPTGDAGALHAGRAIARALEEARVEQNEQGAWISRLEGYYGRQTYDASKIAGGFFRELAQMTRDRSLDWEAAETAATKRAFRAYRDKMLGWLKPETWAGLELKDVSFQDVMNAETEAEGAELLPKARMASEERARAMQLQAHGVIDDASSIPENMLYHAFIDQITGRYAELSGADDHADFRPPASRAASVSKARVFLFKSPEAYAECQKTFGKGSYLSNITDQLDRAGRNAALMARFGPNPDMAWKAEVARLTQQAKLKGEAAVMKRLNGAGLAAKFQAVAGRLNTPANIRLAQIGRGIRSWEGITKLGSIILSKATDLPICGATMARVGGGFLNGYGAFFSGITRLGGAAGKEAADALGVGARAFAGHVGGQFSGSDGAAGWMAWSTRMMYRLNAFEYMNEGVQHGFAAAYSRHLGQEAERAWAGLDIGTRETFERFGISEGDWEKIRHGIEPSEDGAKYFTLDHLERNEQLSPRERRQLGIKVLTMFHDVVDNSTSEARMREKVSVLGGSGGTQEGTVWGTIARSFSQFRGFTTAILGRQLVPAARGYAGIHPVAALAHLIAGTTLAGYVSMNAKLLAKGQAPVSPLDPKAWPAAMAQGGGLGIYGDFLFGEANRNGQDVLGTLAGPAIGDASAVAKMVVQAVNGGAISPRTGRSAIPGEAVQLLSRNTPIINLWYTRLALDYLVYWRLAEAASPGYLQRYQSNVESQQGHSFIVPPTAAQ